MHCKPLPPTLPLPPFLFRFPTARGKSNQVLAFCFCRELRADVGPRTSRCMRGPRAGDAAVALRMLVVLSELPCPAVLRESPA